MTKTNYEKELEREIEEKIEVIEKLKKKLDTLQFKLKESNQIIGWDTKLLKKAKQEEREKILKEFEKFWKQFEKDYDIDGRKVKFELLDSDLEFLKTKTKEIIIGEKENGKYNKTTKKN